MKPIVFVVCLLVALASALTGAPAKPNVLLICVDDLKPLLGCYGDAKVKSPNIDRLAARGVLFEKAFCNQAVCSPSRNALMTGIRPTRLGIYDLGTNFRRAEPEAVTLSQHFMRHGWRAEAMGKIYHVGHGNTNDPASWSVPHWNPRGGGYALKESTESLRPATAGGPRGAATECAEVPDDRYSDGMIANEAISRLRAAKDQPNQPFFLAVGFLKPHLPFVAPKKYWDLYDRAAFAPPKRQTPPEGAPAFAPTTWGELRQYSDMPEIGPLTLDQQRQLIHGYHAAVSYMDAQLGRVLEVLDQLELAKNTIIVLWGDHGWHLGDHGMWCKHTNYEQAARIPLIIAAPGKAQAGGRTQALAETVDIYPTLCELAGLPVSSGLDGLSLAPTLSNPAISSKPAVFHAYPRSPRETGELIGRAVRTERYRLVEWKAPGGAATNAVLELYDYQTDPEETKNLAGDQPEVVKTMRGYLAQLPEAKPQLRAAPNAGAQKAGSSPTGKIDRVALFKRRDENGDGKLTLAEFLQGQPDPQEAPKRFPLFDANQDGVLTQAEFVGGGKKN